MGFMMGSPVYLRGSQYIGSRVREPLEYSPGKTFNAGLNRPKVGELPNYYPANDHWPPHHSFSFRISTMLRDGATGVDYYIAAMEIGQDHMGATRAETSLNNNSTTGVLIAP